METQLEPSGPRLFVPPLASQQVAPKAPDEQKKKRLWTAEQSNQLWKE